MADSLCRRRPIAVSIVSNPRHRAVGARSRNSQCPLIAASFWLFPPHPETKLSTAGNLQHRALHRILAHAGRRAGLCDGFEVGEEPDPAGGGQGRENFALEFVCDLEC